MTCADFICEADLDNAYFVRPSMAYGGKGTLAPCKNKLMKTIIDNGRTNIVTLQSRTLYYAGTYTITCDPMPMSIEDFMMLPKEVCTLFPINASCN